MTNPNKSDGELIDPGTGDPPPSNQPAPDPPSSAAIHRAAADRPDDERPDCAELHERITELERQLAVAREALDHAERRHQIDMLLIEADAIDIDTARLLTELALPEHANDPTTAVDALRAAKPFLFRSTHHAATVQPTTLGVMSADPELTITDEGMRLLELAEQAAERGDRIAVLRYLRARRKK